MKRPSILLIDALINLALGVLIVIFPNLLVEALGIPTTETTFYPSILGAVLIGIAIALFIEWRQRSDWLVGLGLGGAIAINLCGGVVLACWLLFGGLGIAIRGSILLWALVLILVGISGIEWFTHWKRRNDC